MAVHKFLQLMNKRGMESHIIAQQKNEQAATPEDSLVAPPVNSNSSVTPPPTDRKSIADLSKSATDEVRTPGHPDALPLSNSPRKENQYAESPGTADLPSEATERNPLAPSDNSHNRLFKCVECGKRFPSHARLARHLYVCHRALIEGIAEHKGQVALGTRTIPVSQTTSQPVSPVKMAQGGNHLCRLCNRTFTFSSNLRRHIRKMHLQSPCKSNTAFQPTININPNIENADKQQMTSEKLICDLCGQTFLTGGELDSHLRDLHQVIRKKLLFGNRGVSQDRNSPVTVQQKPDVKDFSQKPLQTPLTSYNLQGVLPPPSLAPPGHIMSSSANLMGLQNLLNTQAQNVINIEPIRVPPPPAQLDFSRHTVTPQSKSLSRHPVTPQSKSLEMKREMTPTPLNMSRDTPDKLVSAPMDLSVVKKESPSSQPVDLSMATKQKSDQNTAVDLSKNTLNSGIKTEAMDTHVDKPASEDKNDLEASKSLLRAALQAKQDAKQQHPKLLQLLGSNSGSSTPVTGGNLQSKPPISTAMTKNLALEGLVSQSNLASTAPFSPLLMAAQMNLGFPPTSLATALPHFPGPHMFGSPYPFPLKRKLSGDASQVSPIAEEDAKPMKPAKRRKSSANQGYDSDGSNSPSQLSDNPNFDPKFPSRVDGKRYICGLCGATFTFQTNLTRHQRKLHGKPYVRRPVASHLQPGTLPGNNVANFENGAGTPPASPPRPAMAYDIPPTPPIFGPVLGN